MTAQKRNIPQIWVLEEIYQVFGGRGTRVCLKTAYVMLLLKLSQLPPTHTRTHTHTRLFGLLLEDNYSTSRVFYSKGTLLLTGRLPRSLLALGELQGPGAGVCRRASPRWHSSQVNRECIMCRMEIG